METTCPNGHRIDVSPSQVGTDMRCPTCHQHFVVSSASGTIGNTPSTTTSGRSYSESHYDRPDRAAANRDWWRCGDWDLDLIEKYRPLGELLILLGLLTVITARGCDAVNQRNVTAAQAHAEAAENEWYDRWQEQLDALDAEEEELRARDNLNADERDRLTDLPRERSRLRRQRESERRTETNRWAELRRDATEASTGRRTSEPWLDGTLMIGTLLLVAGLLIVALSPDSPGRWLCIILLAIIVASLFLGGNAWQDALTTTRSAAT